EIDTLLEFRRVLFRSIDIAVPVELAESEETDIELTAEFHKPDHERDLWLWSMRPLEVTVTNTGNTSGTVELSTGHHALPVSSSDFQCTPYWQSHCTSSRVFTPGDRASLNFRVPYWPLIDKHSVTVSTTLRTESGNKAHDEVTVSFETHQSSPGSTPTTSTPDASGSGEQQGSESGKSQSDSTSNPTTESSTPTTTPSEP